MALPQGIDFRATSGFVSDPAQCDYEIGVVVNYPRTTPVQANVVGWETVSSTGMISRDRATGTPKLAGIAGQSNGVTADFGDYRIDLANGNYTIRLAVGDNASQQLHQTVELLDGTTSLGVILNNADTVAADRYFDATGVLRTSSADWVANNAALSIAITSGILRIRCGPNGRAANTGGFTCVAHVFIAAAGGGTAWTKSLTDTITLSDAVAKSSTKAATDSIILSDAVAKSMGKSATDAVTLSDAVAKGVVLSKSDALSIVENFARTVNYHLTRADTITLSDAVNLVPSGVVAKIIHRIVLSRFGFY